MLSHRQLYFWELTGVLQAQPTLFSGLSVVQIRYERQSNLLLSFRCYVLKAAPGHTTSLCTQGFCSINIARPLLAPHGHPASQRGAPAAAATSEGQVSSHVFLVSSRARERPTD